MSTLDEKIESLMQREIKTKTVLVSKEDLEAKKKENISDGWEFVRQVELNGKYKVTFQRVK